MVRGYNIVMSTGGAHYLSLVAYSGTILSHFHGSFTSGYRLAVIFVGVGV